MSSLAVKCFMSNTHECSLNTQWKYKENWRRRAGNCTTLQKFLGCQSLVAPQTPALLSIVPGLSRFSVTSKAATKKQAWDGQAWDRAIGMQCSLP